MDLRKGELNEPAIGLEVMNEGADDNRIELETMNERADDNPIKLEATKEEEVDNPVELENVNEGEDDEPIYLEDIDVAAVDSLAELENANEAADGEPIYLEVIDLEAIDSQAVLENVNEGADDNPEELENLNEGVERVDNRVAIADFTTNQPQGRFFFLYAIFNTIFTNVRLYMRGRLFAFRDGCRNLLHATGVFVRDHWRLLILATAMSIGVIGYVIITLYKAHELDVI